MSSPVLTDSVIRFGEFTASLETGELHRNGTKIKLQGQPFEILSVFLKHPGCLVTREDLRRKLWPSDTFVDFEHGLNSAVNRLREALEDTADKPLFIETVPRRGYCFIAPVETVHSRTPAAEVTQSRARPTRRSLMVRFAVLFGVLALGAGAGFFVYKRTNTSPKRGHQSLTRLTFDDGLQVGATWSPDGRYIAYSSDRGGKFDIWVEQVGGGGPVQVTHGPSQNWQPDWSPDGRYIVYRSEEGEGGIYVVPALGGLGMSRKIAATGYYPRWSPDGTQILFRTTQYLGLNRFYVVGLDGGEPREVLTQFHTQDGQNTMAAAWHPDGKRISVWLASERMPDFWTVSLAGGEPIRSEFTPDVAKQLQEAGLRGIVEWVPDFNFAWSPSGRSIFCALTFRGVVNLWKMTLDPLTLRITAAERLTTGPGPDGAISLSADGRKLAFTAENQHLWAWLFPFDGNRGQLKGAGHAASPDAINVWRLSLSHDDKRLAFSGNRSGRAGIWQHSLLEAHSTPVVADDFVRDQPQWSPDGEHLLYVRWNYAETEGQLADWSVKTGDEHLIGDAKNLALGLDWSPNGKEILVSQANPSTHHSEIWLLPVPGLSSARDHGRRMISDPSYDLHQQNFSPDGRWIAFQAVRDLQNKLESTLYVTSATGGPWIRITDGTHWDDKPRWSPDGKTIYFLSGRSGFFNVWATHFEPSQGKVMGRPSEVTEFNSPARMMPEHVPSVDLSVTQNNLLLTLEQRSGSIWVLDNVEP